MIRPALVLAFASVATPTIARPPILSAPIDCTLGEDCYIQNYVDADPSDGAADFTCGPLSYDGHKGTDFALHTHAAMSEGVAVLPAAPGTVRATRDGMEDQLYGTEGAPDISGRECGNGVVIDHGDGWQTQYCHMRKGSIEVRNGERVSLTTKLGEVGLSGRTQFPHVHLSVRKDGKTVDPFNPNGIISCGDAQSETLWGDQIDYVAGGLLDIGMSDHAPEYQQVKAGTAKVETLTSDAPALIGFAFAYGTQAGDLMELTIIGPSGVVSTHEAALDKSQAQLFRAAGKRGTDWPKGLYMLTAQLKRGTETISAMATTIEVTSP